MGFNLPSFFETILQGDQSLQVDVSTTEFEKEFAFPVKVNKSSAGQALNFSRKGFSSLETSYKHIGIYAYRVDTLKIIAKLPQSQRELDEKLEQLRWLDNGFEIQLAETEHESNSVDTPEDLEALLSLKNI